MELKEKFMLLKSRGYTYDPITGYVQTPKGKILTGKNYVSIHPDRKTSISAHQYGWWWMTNEVPKIVDHINRVKNDNRFCNLRNVDVQKNAYNTDSKGCRLDKRSNRWQAYIKKNYKFIHIGMFETEKEAKEAYENERSKMLNI